MVAKWVSSAWNEISETMVKDSFIGCGFSANRDEESLHSKLRLYLETNSKPIEDIPTGISDEEDDEDIESEEESNEI